jgi:hypothetical protein
MPEQRIYKFTTEEATCPGCGYSVVNHYVLSPDRVAAMQSYSEPTIEGQDGDGLCAECLIERSIGLDDSGPITIVDDEMSEAVQRLDELVHNTVNRPNGPTDEEREELFALWTDLRDRLYNDA